eukprot:4364801-Amphidinium_carterae.1
MLTRQHAFVACGALLPNCASYVGIEKQPAPMLFGKRAWALLGRRIKDSPPGSGPEPDIGLGVPRTFEAKATNWQA